MEEIKKYIRKLKNLDLDRLRNQSQTDEDEGEDNQASDIYS